MIVAGVGFRAGATADSLADAFALAAAGRAVRAVATAREKAEAPALKDFAGAHGLDVIAIDGPRLAAQETRTQSAASCAAHGTGSVAEAAALAAAGSGAALISPRVISADRMATCALAEGDGP